MKYFRLNYTLNTKIRGAGNSTIKEYIYHGSIEDPKFIGRIHFEKVDFEPIPVNPVLFAKANKTDLIEGGGQLSRKILISTKLKSYLQKNDYGIQYFRNSVFHKGIEDEEYWVVNPYESLNQFVDFNKSKIIIRRKKVGGGTYVEDLEVKDLNQFNSEIEEADKKIEIVTIEKIYLKEESLDKDFFVLQRTFGGISFVVSEKLKKEIEDAGCTGIEFQPIELSYNEWVVSGGEREKVYGKSW
ncbi:hypothetical protein E0W68_08465 [Flavobacterium salilacus subsp. salilacus]|uniref:imm11 family protein n=1 Tax=Flavobacterium TaxID=237 RepID=UPI001074C5CF|nr:MULTISPECIES: DUF1629 domain-containing protein [Flavobacterium]KAF2518772.1 hypothetical protein E0W68_08465 [Flavobacterium salilacus subsp. salilacus]MBE1613740.1 hypothetical protein [Flavobacterium sp. SaA2.13]